MVHWFYLPTRVCVCECVRERENAEGINECIVLLESKVWIKCLAAAKELKREEWV